MLFYRSMQEQTKARGTDSPGARENAVNAVLWAANAYQSEVSRLAKRAGLSFPQYSVLRILAYSPEPMSCNRIAERMVSRDPDITRLVDRLAQADCVSRERRNDDRRVVHCEVTEKGRRIVLELDEEVGSLQRRLFNGIEQQELEALIRTLHKLHTPE